MYNKRLKQYLMILVTISIMTPAVAGGAIDKRALQAAARTHIINEVRHELATLPYYGVGVPGLFDVKNELQVETDRPR